MTAYTSPPVLEGLRRSEMVMAVRMAAGSELPSTAIRSWQELVEADTIEGLHQRRETPNTETDGTRFAVTWPRLPNTGFPSYQEMWPEFRGAFDRLQQSAIDGGATAPLVDECELSYLNAITPEEQWSRHMPLEHFLVQWFSQNPYDTFLPSPDEVLTDTRFRIRDGKGRAMGTLSVNVHSLAGEGGVPMMAATISAHGRVHARKLDGAEAFFHTAFDWIVRGFASLASPLDPS